MVCQAGRLSLSAELCTPDASMSCPKLAKDHQACIMSVTRQRTTWYCTETTKGPAHWVDILMSTADLLAGQLGRCKWHLALFQASKQGYCIRNCQTALHDRAKEDSGQLLRPTAEINQLEYKPVLLISTCCCLLMRQACSFLLLVLLLFGFALLRRSRAGAAGWRLQHKFGQTEETPSGSGTHFWKPWPESLWLAKQCLPRALLCTATSLLRPKQSGKCGSPKHACTHTSSDQHAA